MDLRYPIGKFEYHGPATDDERRAFLDHIEAAPARFREAVKGLSQKQLDTPYRPEGWTVRQVVHHVVDSHINSYVRFRLVLTEHEPAIKAYDDRKWAELMDARTAPVDLSLDLLEALHKRWIVLLRSLTSEDCARAFVHSEMGKVTLDRYISYYAWHGRHHAAHITSLRERMRW